MTNPLDAEVDGAAHGVRGVAADVVAQQVVGQQQVPGAAMDLERA